MIVDALVYLTRDEPHRPMVFATWNDGELDGPYDLSVNHMTSNLLAEADVLTARMVRLRLPDAPLLAELRGVPQTVPAEAVADGTEVVSGDGWPYRWDCPPEQRDASRRMRYLGEDGGGLLRGEVYAVAAHLDRFNGVSTLIPTERAYATVEAFWRAWETVA